VRAAAPSHLAALPLFFRANAVEKGEENRARATREMGKRFFFAVFCSKIAETFAEIVLVFDYPPLCEKVFGRELDTGEGSSLSSVGGSSNRGWGCVTLQKKNF